MFNPKNNFLNEVIDKKVGLPITISIFYVEVAKFIGLELKIIGFPGHILVKYNEEIILDDSNFSSDSICYLSVHPTIGEILFGGEYQWTNNFCFPLNYIP